MKQVQTINSLTIEAEVDPGTGEYHGPCRLLKNGKVLSEKQYIHGKADGLCTEYYESGQMRSRGAMCNGLQIGVWEWWGQSGRLLAIGHFEGGREHGVWKEFCEDGNVLCGLWDHGQPWDGEFMINNVYHKYQNGQKLFSPGAQQDEP